LEKHAQINSYLKTFFTLTLFVSVAFFVSAGDARAEIRMVKGQTVYVPVYSHIYHGNRDKEPVDLAATLSIRNTDFENSITVNSVDYYDSDGILIKKHLDKNIVIKPMGSTRIIVKESDRSGGSGASFIVRWETATKVTLPVIETVMIGTQAQQGISFTARGQAIKETE